jgi:hypothetical protein
MIESLFADWPNGIGPMVVQVFIAVIGASFGIKLFDDATAVLARVRNRRNRSS